jgi:putative transposase
MSHTFSQNYLHVIFSTKDRRKIITKELQPRLWAYLRGIGKNYEMIVLAVGGTEDHVHTLFHLPPKLALAKAVLLLKANSSKWMTEAGNEFSWQEGYGAFSVSSSSTDSVIQYIKNQESIIGNSVSKRSSAPFSRGTAWNRMYDICQIRRCHPRRDSYFFLPSSARRAISSATYSSSERSASSIWPR